MRKRYLVPVLIALLAAVSARAELPVEDVDSLPAYNVDLRRSSVSGISSGGYMAQQFHTAYSDALIGAGIIAGGPYYCAENNVTIALTRCMDPSEADPPDPARLAWLTRELAADGRVADPAGMAEDYVWLFGSPADDTVHQRVMDTLEAYYRHFVPAERIAYVDDLPAAHSMVTSDYGYPCGHVGDGNNPDDHFINDCDYDAAGQLLQHVYRRLRPPAAAPAGRLIRFPQGEFLPAPRSHGLDDRGYAYIPQSCERGARCRVHVVFHGCRQYEERIGEVFVRHAGYNDWADANRTIVLYPQTVPTPTQGNGNGCWDWWGYDDANYMARNGRQMRAVKAMLDRLAGAYQPGQPPAAPSGLTANVAADGSVSLSWAALADPQVDSYVVYRADAAAGRFLAVSAQGLAQPRLTLSGLAPGTHYFIVTSVGSQQVESQPTPALAVVVPGL